MIAKYETPGYMYPTIGYDRSITDITRQGDTFFIHNIRKDPIASDCKSAVYALIGVYYHFLISGGNIRKKLPAASDPDKIWINITKNGLSDGAPGLSLSETKECLGLILKGLCSFHNSHCRNYAIGQGIGYMIRKIYEPYRTSNDMELHDIFYAMIARGSFSLQMNNEIMARSFYKGLYSAWDYATAKNRYFFGGMSHDATVSFDDILSRKDVTMDPMHDWRMYPWNMYCFNIDNLILTYCAATEYVATAEKVGGISAEGIKPYKQVTDFIHDFFTSVSPLYRVRCNYFNNRPDEDLKYDSDPIENYSNIRTALEKYSTLSMDYVPYLFYCCELFRSTANPKTHIYEGIASNFTHRDYKTLDNTCPIFGQRYSENSQKGISAELLLKLLPAITIVAFSTMVFIRIAAFEARTGAIKTTCIVLIILFILGASGTNNNSGTN